MRIFYPVSLPIVLPLFSPTKLPMLNSNQQNGKFRRFSSCISSHISSAGLFFCTILTRVCVQNAKKIVYNIFCAPRLMPFRNKWFFHFFFSLLASSSTNSFPKLHMHVSEQQVESIRSLCIPRWSRLEGSNCEEMNFSATQWQILCDI